jgi:methyltransferase OMS1, mitochondrial
MAPSVIACAACLCLALVPYAKAVSLERADSGRTRRQVLQASLAAASSLPLVLPHALTPQEASRQYDSFAPTYNQLDGGAASDMLGLVQARHALLSKASGRVLEIGVGTGLNLEHYHASLLTSLTLLDVSHGMLSQARERLIQFPNLPDVRIVQADATSELVSMFGTGVFDTVVDSFSLCVMGNKGAVDCLGQVAAVLKPGGQALLLENSRSSNPVLGWYQDATAEAAALGGKGCLYNQDVGRLISLTGKLRIVQEDQYAAGLFRAYTCVRL